MDVASVVNQYLDAFWSGDFTAATRLIADGFTFRGPLAQTDDRQTFFASAAPLAPIVRGHELVRQWIDGDEVCSLYQSRLDSPVDAGSVLIAEWDTVRDGRVASAQLAFDTDAFRRLLPSPARPVEPAVALARAHLNAWTNQDFDSARANLAPDVEFFSPAAHLVGIDQYMEGPGGLTQFARQVVPGSLRVVATAGNASNALITYEISTGGGSLGTKLFQCAQTWLLDEHGKIKVERIISFAVPLAVAN